MKYILTIVAVLCFAVVSQAVVTVTVSSAGADNNYLVTLTSDGDPISGVEITAQPVVDIDAEPVPGFIVDTLYLDQALALGPIINQDTHLMFNSTDITVASGNESDTELFNAAVALKVPVSTLQVANIVPLEATVPVIIKAVVGTGDNKVLVDATLGEMEEVNDSEGVVIIVPEPASLSLLALGGLLAIRRR